MVLLLSYVVFMLLMSGDLADILRAYPSPEKLEGVHEIALSEARGVYRSKSEKAGEDFDGDGTPDELDVEYFHMEPLHRRTTSGMLHVRSGRTNQVVLARAVATPMADVHWCGDLDLNGTDDLFIADDGRRFALGFERPR